MFFSNHELDALTKKQLHESASAFLFLGISSLVLGSLALYFAFFSTLITIYSLGVILIIMGILEEVHALHVRAWKNFFLHLCLGILYLVGGALIIGHPLVSEINLTLLLAFFFIVSGLVRIVFSLSHHIVHKGWQVLNGLISFILGLLIWQQWPESGLWVIGVFVGINALMAGWTLLMLYYAAKHIK
jgi:uncharacterized membrane protein HdeD (DUF308 family)